MFLIGGPDAAVQLQLGVSIGQRLFGGNSPVDAVELNFRALVERTAQRNDVVGESAALLEESLVFLDKLLSLDRRHSVAVELSHRGGDNLSGVCEMLLCRGGLPVQGVEFEPTFN